jgi:hypothetical protein
MKQPGSRSKLRSKIVSKGLSKRASTIPDSVGYEYRSGIPGMELVAKYKTSWFLIRQKLLSLGIEIRPTGFAVGSPSHPDRKVDLKNYREIGRLHMRGMKHPEIGKRFGISRERVRQIVALIGLPVRSKTLRKQTQERLHAKAADRAEKAKIRRGMIAAASELWKRGANWAVIADVMGWNCYTAAQFHSALGQLRRAVGETRFPLRDPDHWKVKGERHCRA